MNAPLDRKTFSRKPLTDAPLDFVGARSRLLDAFFELEVAVTRWLRHLGAKEPLGPFGQRVEQLANHGQLAAKATQRQARHLQSLPAKLARILAIRNAAVHSRWVYGVKEDEPSVIFDGIENVLGGGLTYTVVTLCEIEEAARQARSLAGHLENYLSQASLPRPPSPGAATDP